MRPAALAALLCAAAVAGCAGSRSDVHREDGYSLAYFRKTAVPAFIDPSGRGAEVAQALRARLIASGQGVADPAAVDPILKQTPGETLGLETLERLKFQAGVDSLVLGRMAPDWSSASVLFYETDMGDSLLRAVVRPEKGRKAFESADDAAARTLAVLTGK